MKAPEECADVQDIRSEIDHIDKEIITLIGKRFEYVRAAIAYGAEMARERYIELPAKVVA
ncbi:MAG: chorismate mutase [bacterium]|nr:chorismate mutase [bacterium]